MSASEIFSLLEDLEDAKENYRRYSEFGMSQFSYQEAANILVDAFNKLAMALAALKEPTGE